MNQIITPVRNNAIDSLKLICALLVVFIHCEYPYKKEILPITDVAVPLFFCISGYFVYGAKRSWKRIGRIGIIFSIAFILYLLKTEVFHFITNSTFFIPSWKDVYHLVCFNDVVFAIHLWYLPAYLYVLVIAYIIDKYKLWKIAFYSIIPLLLIGGFVAYRINLTTPTDIFYYRNTYFVGLPYFLTGAFIKSKFNYPPLFVNKYVQDRVVQGVSLIVITLFIARFIVVGDNLFMVWIRSLNLWLLSASILFLTIRYYQKNENSISLLGKRYSLYIYIFHLLIMSIMERVANYLPVSVNHVYMYMNPIVVFVISILLTYILQKFKIIRL